MKLKAKKDALTGRLWGFPLTRMGSSVLSNCIPAVLLILWFRVLKTFIFSFLFPLGSSSGPPPRLQLARHGGVGGLCAFLRGDGGPLLPFHGRSRAWRRVRLLPDPAQPLFFLLLLALPFIFILSAWGLSQGRHIQELEEVPGGVHGDSDVHGLHPGEGAAQTGPQRCWRLIPSAVTAALKCNWSHSSYIFILEIIKPSFISRSVWGESAGVSGLTAREWTTRSQQVPEGSRWDSVFMFCTLVVK